MSDATYVITFDKDKLWMDISKNSGEVWLDMRFSEDNYETGSVQFKFESRDGRLIIDKEVTIPVVCLFDMAFLISMNIRRVELW